MADASVFAGLLAILYALFASGRIWFAPFTPVANISSSPRALPLYAAYSFVRIAIAYVLALLFALGYGFAAAKSERAAKILLPLLDILQSIPVLSFLPGVMLAMVALFPRSQLGLELGSILLIFTGQAWNIAFSFYASLKGIPRELDEAARLYRFSVWQRFTELELPFAAIGLVWNSMMSVAGGWFFLMACEMFVLGARDFRLPGLGSYLQVAAGAGDTRAILWGMAAMIAVIVLLDQLVWRPAIAWSDKFKFETVEGAAPQSFVLTVLRRSGMFAKLYRSAIYPLEERVTHAFAVKNIAARAEMPPENSYKKWLARAIGAAILAAMAWLAYRALFTIAQLGQRELLILTRDAALTFLRVNAALVLGALWAIPAGVWIGTTPRVAKFAQPLVQIA
ncbi:MAG TPA: ABC transporter permease subunit, partial [Candidatus Acidoferrales bacterium]|nr:ABC transporter permease subunit [Candidatus Acidoferrales bacterium]